MLSHKQKKRDLLAGFVIKWEKFVSALKHNPKDTIDLSNAAVGGIGYECARIHAYIHTHTHIKQNPTNKYNRSLNPTNPKPKLHKPQTPNPKPQTPTTRLWVLAQAVYDNPRIKHVNLEGAYNPSRHTAKISVRTGQH